MSTISYHLDGILCMDLLICNNQLFGYSGGKDYKTYFWNDKSELLHMFVGRCESWVTSCLIVQSEKSSIDNVFLVAGCASGLIYTFNYHTKDIQSCLKCDRNDSVISLCLQKTYSKNISFSSPEFNLVSCTKNSIIIVWDFLLGSKICQFALKYQVLCMNSLLYDSLNESFYFTIGMKRDLTLFNLKASKLLSNIKLASKINSDDASVVSTEFDVISTSFNPKFENTIQIFNDNVISTLNNEGVLELWYLDPILDYWTLP